MQKIYIVILSLLCANLGFAQDKYFTRNGTISFLSKSPLEDIKAVNKQASCIYDFETNRIVAKVLIKAFKFEKALMQEHFNENYMESDKYPKASFKGKFVNKPDLAQIKNHETKLSFEGNINIHGITKPMKINALISMKSGTLFVKTTFSVKLKDFEIEIPSTVINNISETIKVSAKFKLDKFN